MPRVLSISFSHHHSMIIAANAQDIIKFPFLQTTHEYSAYYL
jgi:hypothetical protein